MQHTRTAKPPITIKLGECGTKIFVLILITLTCIYKCTNLTFRLVLIG
jgi:hypothetical protein